MGSAEDAVRRRQAEEPIKYRVYVYGEVIPKIVGLGQLIRRELDRLSWPNAIINDVRPRRGSKVTKKIALFPVCLEGWSIPTVHVGSDGVVYTAQPVEGVADPGCDSGGYLLYAECPITDDHEMHMRVYDPKWAHISGRNDAPHILEKLEEALQDLQAR